MKLFSRGSVPAGVMVPCGVITTTESPGMTPSALAVAPEHDAELAGFRVRERSRAHVLCADVTTESQARRIDAADNRRGWRRAR